MSAEYIRVIVNEIDWDGFSEDETAILAGLFCHLAGKLEGTLEKEAEFNLCDFNLTKNNNLKHLNLVIEATSKRGERLWCGTFMDQTRSATIIGYIEPV